MLKIFVGYDPRQPIALQVLVHTLYKYSSVPLSIIPLVLSQLPIKRRGLTEFTYSRYLVPFLCGFNGKALFLDADMMANADIAELFSKMPEFCPVAVVKNQKKFEWPSLMLFNCSHSDCKKLTPKYIDDVTTKLHTLEWAREVGELPKEWNHCVGYAETNPEAKLIHFTAGIPCFEETKDCEWSKKWNHEAWSCNSSVTWNELMGNSVHVDRVRQGFN